MKDRKIGKWRVLDTEYLIRRPWLTARKDTVELPDGRVNNEYYLLEYPAWVNVIAITKDGEYVMVEQYRHGLGDVFVELCAGVVEDGEAPVDAARRELLEETGYTGGEWRLLDTICQNPSTCTNYTYCFLAEGVEKTDIQHLDETEEIAVRILSEKEVLNLLVEGKMKQSLMVAPLWHYLAVKNMWVCQKTFS